MKKQHLLETFELARRSKSDFVFVGIKLPDCEVPEVIINRRENFDAKEKYYLETYDDNLIHNHNSNISIVGLSYGGYEQLKNIY